MACDPQSTAPTDAPTIPAPRRRPTEGSSTTTRCRPGRSRTTLTTDSKGRARSCRVCREALHEGLNWTPRYIAGRAWCIANGTICSPCERAAALVRSSKVARRFTHAKYQARRRGHAWGLSFKTFARLLAQPCAYCAGPLSPYGTGLDRLRNELGYRAGNVVPACAACHRLRGFGLSPSEVKLVLSHRAQGAHAGAVA